MNSNSSLANKRIPSLVGILMIIGSIFAISWMSTNGILFKSKASTNSTPKNVLVTNKTDRDLTITYITDDPTEGTISYGIDVNQMTSIAFDTRDSATSQSQFRVHSISLSNLLPDTQYFYIINSGQNSYKDNDDPYSVISNAASNTDGVRKTITGKILMPDELIFDDALSILSGDGLSPQSSIVSPDGTYVISIPITSTDLSSSTLSLTITNGVYTSIVKLFSSTESVPIITLSQNYDFTGVSAEQPISSDSATTSFSDISTVNDTTPLGIKPAILTPEKDESLHDQQPSFAGTALPNETVEIVIQSDPISATVTADSSGNWEYRPDSLLPPGKHTITIKTKDSNGILKTIMQSFTVFAEGTQFLDPSVSPVQTTPTSTVTPSPTLTPTTTPVGGIPTQTPTIIPTQTLTPTPTPVPQVPTAKPSLPEAGSMDAIGIGLATISSIVVGSILFLLSRRSSPL